MRQRFIKNIFFILLLITFLFANVYIFAQSETRKYTILKTRLVDSLENLNLHTGDMAFFQNQTFNGKMTQIGTLSPFTHSAMIVVTDNGDILLTHATLNDYNGYAIPVIGEEKPRTGTILTRLDNLFLSVDNLKSGYYKHIWIRKLKDSKIIRPTSEEVLKLYQKYKDYPFESSNLNFVLSALDVFLFNHDIFLSPNNKTFMCSEYISYLFKDLSFPIQPKQPPRETTPADIYLLLDDYYDYPIIFEFKNGKYQIISGN